MRASATTSYDEPFAWWGPVWNTPTPRSVLDLIGGGVLSTETAALLWALLHRRASLAVVAGPSGAGKTTLLTALLDFLPPGTRRLYLRGCYEPFAFLDDPAVDPLRSVLLANEISAHLPSYLWGPGVRRVLAATERGFALAATLHATSATEMVGSLAGFPLRVPPAEVALLDVVVVLEARALGGQILREVGSVAMLTAIPGGGVSVATVAGRPAFGAPLVIDPECVAAVATRLGWVDEARAVGREIAARAVVLGELALSPPADLAVALATAGRRWDPQPPSNDPGFPVFPRR